MKNLRVAFVCTGNSFRSQVAEAFAKKYGEGLIEAYSAGTNPAEKINENAVSIMQEVGIDISDNKPKLIEDIPSSLDVLVTMGCNVVCPFVPNHHQEDWALDDPAEKTLDFFRETRDIIEQKVKDLLKRIKTKEI